MTNSITFLNNTPLNRLFLAINHYISTGDYIGQGMASPVNAGLMSDREAQPEDKIRVLIPYNITSDVDLDDLACFKSRFAELQEEFSTRLEPVQGHGDFGCVGFVIYYKQCEPLAKALKSRPGPKGWGSIKPIIDQHVRS